MEKRRDKREKREKKREKEREKRGKYRKKREIERKEKEKEKRERKDVQGQLLSLCIQFAKRKTKYIGRNAQNFKKLLYLYIYYRLPSL